MRPWWRSSRGAITRVHLPGQQWPTAVRLSNFEERIVNWLQEENLKLTRGSQRTLDGQYDTLGERHNAYVPSAIAAQHTPVILE